MNSSLGDDIERIQVLHVDDDSGFTDLTARFLEREDDRIDVRTATTTEEGFDALNDHEIDCIVSDYEMPEMTGIEFLEAVRENYPELPFVLFTGKGSEEIASEAISAGVTEYLQKRTTGGTGQYELLANRITNVVEATRSTRLLNERSRRLETLISNLPGMIYRARNEPSWPMVTVEGEIETLTGYPAESIETNAVAWGEEIIHPDDREPMWEAVQDALAEGRSFEVTYRIVTEDGATKWVWEQGQGVYEGEDLVALEGFITDVTERQKYEERLKSLNRATRRLLAGETAEEVAEIGVEVARDVLDLDANAIHLADETSPELQPVAATDPAYDLVGELPTFTPGNSIAWQVYESGEPRAIDSVREDPKVYNPDTPIRSELHLPLDDYGLLIAGSPTRAAFDQEDILLGEILARNITTALEHVQRTEKLQARERKLSRQNDRLEQFASIISHDLRNPLSVAQGRLELAEGQCDSEHLAAVGDAHDRMRTLIEDLLTLAREGDDVDDLESVDLAAITRDCWANVQTAEATLVTDASGTILADRSRLKQLFENLVRNSVEHGSAGSRSQSDHSVEHGSTSDPPGSEDEKARHDEAVTITVGELDDGFYVEDDGPGIPEAERETVFEAGYSTSGEGTGFGLSIVERIADAHGWQIRVLDGSRGGARFEITGVEFVDR
jgi:PAS domain S-box-containing protein